jgi:hypothetical protein
MVEAGYRSLVVNNLMVKEGYRGLVVKNLHP